MRVKCKCSNAVHMRANMRFQRYAAAPFGKCTRERNRNVLSDVRGTHYTLDTHVHGKGSTRDPYQINAPLLMNLNMRAGVRAVRKSKQC